MSNTYIDIPTFTTLHDIESRNYTLSATQYKTFCIKNANVHTIAEFLDRELSRSDLGYEVGSENYVDTSPFTFIKTKALQSESFLLAEGEDAFESISPKSFVNMDLKSGDVLISKDSNVGEIIILDKDYPNAMLCGGIYRLPLTADKYYLMAFMKSDLFRQQIDFLVPRGSTIRHGKTKFLECLIPLPNYNPESTIKYIELLIRAIINKEIAIRDRYQKALKLIREELRTNQKDNRFVFAQPTINEIICTGRLDSSLYSKEFKEEIHLITNYKYGVSNIYELDFDISRGQNLQVSNIGRSIESREYYPGFYQVVKPTVISTYGTISQKEYLGNSNKLKTLKCGDIIFGAEGTFRSFVCLDEKENIITNIHGITINQNNQNIQKSIFVKLMLDYFREHNICKSCSTGGNGGSLAIKYWDILKFPNFPDHKEKELTKLYNNPVPYNSSNCTLDDFLEYDDAFNTGAGIYELDKSMKYLQEKLEKAIDDIAKDNIVNILF